MCKDFLHAWESNADNWLTTHYVQPWAVMLVSTTSRFPPLKDNDAASIAEENDAVWRMLWSVSSASQETWSPLIKFTVCLKFHRKKCACSFWSNLHLEGKLAICMWTQGWSTSNVFYWEWPNWSGTLCKLSTSPELFIRLGGTLF